MKRVSNIAFLQACLIHSSFYDLYISVDINRNASQHSLAKDFNSGNMSSSVIRKIRLYTQKEVTKQTYDQVQN
jgi:hypothetical protein